MKLELLSTWERGPDHPWPLKVPWHFCKSAKCQHRRQAQQLLCSETGRSHVGKAQTNFSTPGPFFGSSDDVILASSGHKPSNLKMANSNFLSTDILRTKDGREDSSFGVSHLRGKCPVRRSEDREQGIKGSVWSRAPAQEFRTVLTGKLPLKIYFKISSLAGGGKWE